MIAARMRKSIMTARKSPMRNGPIANDLKPSARPRRRPAKGFTISLTKAVTTFCTAEPRMKPIARPMTPRSRTNVTNPANAFFGVVSITRLPSGFSGSMIWTTFISSVIPSLYTVVDGLIHQPIRLCVLLARDVAEMHRAEIGKQRLHFRDLRFQRRFLDLPIPLELLDDEFRIEPELDIPCDADGFRFLERDHHCFVFGPVVRLLAKVFFYFGTHDAVLENHYTCACRTWIVAGPAVSVDDYFRHYTETGATPLPARVRYACARAKSDTGMETKRPTKSAMAPRMLMPMSARMSRKRFQRLPLVRRMLSLIASMGPRSRSMMR